MKIHQHNRLTKEEIERLCVRPAVIRDDTLATTRQIIEDVARNGDNALKSYNTKFDGSTRENLAVSDIEKQRAAQAVSKEFTLAVSVATRNIEAFHRVQLPQSIAVETMPGVLCRREWRPIERVGLYIPGGSAPLVSTVLMLGIPARLAKCNEVVLCTPPSKTRTVAAEILYAVTSLGINHVFAVGGAQAIAAMAVGTESIPKVGKIFGPGNRFVTAAKALVQQQPYNVAIDMLAGPSELLVIADETAKPRWIAADLLSQAEHGADSQVVLVATSRAIAENVQSEMERQRQSLQRNTAIAQALEASFILVVDSIDEAFEFSNFYAPEHLELAIAHAEQFVPHVKSAGSVFVGNLSSVVFGDYASGTNHTLPTNGTARTTGGITVESFMKPISFQTVDRTGFSSLADAVATLAHAEGLDAHANAVRVRREDND